MAALVPIGYHRQLELVSKSSADLRVSMQTSRLRPNSKNSLAIGRDFQNSIRRLGVNGICPRVSRRHRNAAVTCRAGTRDEYAHCKCAEDAVMAIMKDTIQHCLNKECDVMRDKVLNQMGQGLAALCRVSVGVAAESTLAPIPITVPYQLSTIHTGDLEQIRRMLQLTSLPFNTTHDEDLNRLINMLQAGDGEDVRRTLSGSELTQICERLGADLVQCLGPLVMCFPELPLWAKHRALLLPVEVAGEVAFSLLAGSNGWRTSHQAVLLVSPGFISAID